MISKVKRDIIEALLGPQDYYIKKDKAISIIELLLREKNEKKHSKYQCYWCGDTNAGFYHVKCAQKMSHSSIKEYSRILANYQKTIEKLKSFLCPKCEGQQMVCENHPEIPWDDGERCHCGGAGMACECYPHDAKGLRKRVCEKKS